MAKRRAHGEGTISKRQDGRWEARLTLPSGQRKVWYAKTQRAAQEKLTAARRAIHDGLPVVPERQTVGGYLDQWLQGVQPSLRQSAYAAYELNVRRAKPLIGGKRLAQLTPADLQALYSALLAKGLSGRPLSKRSVEQCHTVLHAAWKQAVAWGLMPRNPAEYVSVPRPERKEMRTLSREQVQTLFGRTADHRLHALWVLLATTGLRLGEATGLAWDDIDWKASTLRVQRALQVERATKQLILVEPKSKQSRRTVHLVDGTLAVLRAHRDRQTFERQQLSDAYQNQGFVFAMEDGSPLHPRWVGDTFRRLLPRLGLPRVRIHDIRHTAASLLLEDGVHPKVVQELLGHSTIAITLDLYSHVAPGMHREAVARFQRLFSG